MVAFGHHSHIAIFLVASSWRLVYYWENSDFGVRRSNTLGSYQQEVCDWIFWFHIRISFCFSVRISNGKIFWKKLPKDYLMPVFCLWHFLFLSLSKQLALKVSCHVVLQPFPCGEYLQIGDGRPLTFPIFTFIF